MFGTKSDNNNIPQEKINIIFEKLKQSVIKF